MLPPRNSDPRAAAALQAAVTAVCKRWKPVVLWLLLDGPRRYNALLAALDGVTPKVLTEQLRELEREELIARRVVAGRAKHVEYCLTPRCHSRARARRIARVGRCSHNQHQPFSLSGHPTAGTDRERVPRAKCRAIRGRDNVDDHPWRHDGACATLEVSPGACSVLVPEPERMPHLVRCHRLQVVQLEPAPLPIAQRERNRRLHDLARASAACEQGPSVRVCPLTARWIHIPPR